MKSQSRESVANIPAAKTRPAERRLGLDLECLQELEPDMLIQR